MFETINEDKNTRLYEIIVQRVKEKISRGELKPGDKLPSERALTQEFNVSRATVREAMKTLNVLGLVSIKHGQGVYISQDIQQNLIEHLTPFFFSKSDSIKNLFEIRKTLESQAASWAARRSREREIKKMTEELERFKILLKENKREIKEEDIREHNNKFHLLIFSMSQNPVLIRIMNNLNELINNIYGHTVEIPDRMERSLEEHQSIFLALKKGEAEEAKNKMLNHLDEVEKEIVKMKFE